MDLIVDVPEQFALSLLTDDLAGLPLRDRSDGAVVQTVIEVFGVAANLTSIVVAAAEFPEIARRLLAWVRRSDEHKNDEASPAEIRISTPNGFVVHVPIPPDGDHSAIEITVAEVSSALERAVGEQVVLRILMTTCGGRSSRSTQCSCALSAPGCTGRKTSWMR